MTDPHPSYIITALHGHLRKVSELEYMNSNPRVHDGRSVSAIGESLRTFKQTKPVVLASDAKTVIAGNGTLEAARALKWEWIAAVVSQMVPGSDEARAYAIADNRTTDLSTFDFDIVGATLKSIDKTLRSASGFALDAFPSIDDAEDEPEPGSRPSDVGHGLRGNVIESGASSVSRDVLAGETSPEDEARATTGGGTGTTPGVSFSIRYDLVFETDEEQQEFFEFARWLKSTYPDVPTVGGRVVEFLRTRGADVWGR
jgi:hypothetical protein